MEIEKIELLETLKAGSDMWLKGTVFDRKDGPFPTAVAAEVRLVVNPPQFVGDERPVPI